MIGSLSRFGATRALVFGLLFFVATAATARPAPGAAQVTTEIARIATASKGIVGVAAVHLPSGRRIEVNGNQPFEMASTLKLPLALYALKLGEQGKISLTDALPVQRDQLIEPGILYEHFPFPGIAISTLNAIELSVTVSDNGATDIIYSRVGGPRAVNAWLKSLGLSGINMGTKTVRETFAEEEIPQPATSSAQPDLARTSTPNAMAELLARLYRGELLSDKTTATILDVMKRTQGERISLQLPPGATVRHKTGTLFGAHGLSVNDVGIIDMPDGGAIAIAVFIKDSPESVTHATRDKVIGAISRAIYDYFVLSR